MSYEQLLEHAESVKARAVYRAFKKNEDAQEYARYSGPEGYFADIPGRIQAYTGIPDPAEFDPLIDRLRAVMGELSAGHVSEDPVHSGEVYPANMRLAPLTTAADYLEGWTGTAAMAFKEHFLDPFPLVAQNQFVLTAVLKSALLACRAMWASARKDIDGVLHATMAALDNDPCCDPNKWTFEFTVVSSIATVGGVVATALTDGLAAPLVFAAIDATSAAVGAKPPESIKDNKTGQTAIQIVNAMWDGLRKAVTLTADTERLLHEKAGILLQQAVTHRDLFVAAHPAIAGATAANATSGAYFGEHLR
ncbi:hypothetical protein [Dactylosporangium sp. CA-233914]|uniref:hypothetical protein n=1 Tax=Dactylosporangium sp. CA-233914 TaxID=3239934 RepID=UPI003D8F9AE7